MQNAQFQMICEFPKTNISPLPGKLVYNSSSHWPEHQLGPKGHVHLSGRVICHAKLFDDLTNMQFKNIPVSENLSIDQDDCPGWSTSDRDH